MAREIKVFAWPLLLALGIWMSCAAAAAPLSGRVVGITDGDTIRLLTPDYREYKIRLAEIDAPESGQPFGAKSKRMLSDMIYGKTIEARVNDTDRYGRLVANLRLGNTDINAEMVKLGGAWAYRKYLNNQRFLIWEDQARQARRGLWGLQADQIQPPWEWRAARRHGGQTGLSAPSTGATTKPLALSNAQCGTKTYCREMVSCEEAVFHLKVCGLARLDGDHDGKPCEKLCS